MQRRLRPDEITPAPSEASVSLDNFHFIDCLGRTSLGELWKVETPEGMPCLLKLVNTFACKLGEENTAAQLNAIRHRGLIPARVVSHTANRLAIITPTVRESLASRLQEVRQVGKVGIPRLELLRHLLSAARTLDELKKLYGLQHLGLNPRNLIFVEEELKIADFGLVPLVWIPGGQNVAQINPRYSAPELFDQKVSRTCDQFSLALLFFEMLTGDPLYGSRTPSQLAALRGKAQDSLDLVPSFDRPAMARALHPEPEKRYPSNVDFLRALIEQTPGGEDLLTEDGLSCVEREMKQREEPAETLVTIRVDRVAVRRTIDGILHDLTGQRELREFRTAPYFYRPGAEIEHRCYARLVPGTLRLKLSGFIDQWKLNAVKHQPDVFRFHMRLVSSLWRRMVSSPPVLELDLQALSPSTPEATLTEVRLLIRPVGCSRDEGAAALEKWGPSLIDSLRTFLQVGPERRKHLRLPLQRFITAKSLQGNPKITSPIEGRSVDISVEGMGLRLPVQPQSQLLLTLSRGRTDEPVYVPARVVRCRPHVEGGFDVGVLFALDPMPSS